MSSVRCSACDTVFDGDPYGPEIQTHGHPQCPNPVCNPKLAEALAAKREADARELADFQAWKLAKAAKGSKDAAAK